MDKRKTEYMKLVFYSVVLNHHQAHIADAFYDLLGKDYCFVETVKMEDGKGATEDYSKRPYLLRAWECEDNAKIAMELAKDAEVCVFSGVSALPFLKERMNVGKLSFDMGERWLKRGLKNMFSPAIFKMFSAYHFGGWRKKPLYKLCCSAFAAGDQYRLGTFNGKCYKWGYFTKIEKNEVEISQDVSTSGIAPFMWCSRYLKLKHPELPILMAERLKGKGYKFHLDMYGEGEYKQKSIELVDKLGLQNEVSFYGNRPNNELMNDMQRHSIFLFTSDRNEGWGAVANESMSNGCVLVSSNAVGSAPYLIQDGETGLLFKSPRTNSSFDKPDNEALDSLCDKVEWLLLHNDERQQIGIKARRQLEEVWSPENAARSLLTLINDLSNGRDSSIDEGPCSKA